MRRLSLALYLPQSRCAVNADRVQKAAVSAGERLAMVEKNEKSRVWRRPGRLKRRDRAGAKKEPLVVFSDNVKMRRLNWFPLAWGDQETARRIRSK